MKPLSDAELDERLRAARIPEREASYWDRFPGTVTRRSIEVASDRPRASEPRPVRALRWGLGLAGASLLVLLASNLLESPRSAPPEPDPVAMHRSFEEIATLFPNRVRSVVRDRSGLRMNLADSDNVPSEPPIYAKICVSGACAQLIAFSGQEVSVDGERYEVLIDTRGDVLIVGRHFVWTSARAEVAPPGLRIRAGVLRSPS